MLHPGLGRGGRGHQRDVGSTRRTERGQVLRHLRRGPGRGQPFEFSEREMVQALELAGQQSPGLRAVGVQPAPHVDAVPGRRRPAEGRRGLGDLLFRLGEAASRAEDRQPAVAVPGGPPHGRLSLPADDDRHRRVRRGLDAGRGEPEELTGVIDGLAAGQRAQHVQALVHPAAAGRRVDPAVSDLAAVFAGHPDAERQPAGRQLADRGELAGRQHRMAQCEQVHPDQHREPALAQRGRRGGEPVEAGAIVKADVVADAHVVQAGLLDPAQQRPAPDGIGDHQAVVHRDPDLHRAGRSFRKSSCSARNAKSIMSGRPGFDGGE